MVRSDVYWAVRVVFTDEPMVVGVDYWEISFPVHIMATSKAWSLL